MALNPNSFEKMDLGGFQVKLPKVTDEQLAAIAQVIGAAIDSIENQIETARRSDRQLDWNWLGKATRALDVLKRKRDVLDDEFAARENPHTLEWYFFDAAQELLSPAEYQRILSRARMRKVDAENERVARHVSVEMEHIGGDAHKMTAVGVRSSAPDWRKQRHGRARGRRWNGRVIGSSGDT